MHQTDQISPIPVASNFWGPKSSPRDRVLKILQPVFYLWWRHQVQQYRQQQGKVVFLFYIAHSVLIDNWFTTLLTKCTNVFLSCIITREEYFYAFCWFVCILFFTFGVINWRAARLLRIYFALSLVAYSSLVILQGQ
jgi:hypothetical protein